MYYETMPLYPELRQGCERDSCVRVPMFGGGHGGQGGMPDPCQCRRVTIENPCRPGERAEVLLGVDDCGNLVVCVRRERECRSQCRPQCRPARPCRGRLYGSWS